MRPALLATHLITTSIYPVHYLTRQLAWKTQTTMTMVALFATLAFALWPVLTNAPPTHLCFTTSERRVQPDSNEWQLADFGEYMLSRCLVPYANPGDLYPNATTGAWSVVVGWGDLGLRACCEI